MKVIHFTEGAAEPFESSQVSLTKFVPLLQGPADTYVTCLHFLPGASVVELPTAHECALLVVSGFATVMNFDPPALFSRSHSRSRCDGRRGGGLRAADHSWCYCDRRECRAIDCEQGGTLFTRARHGAGLARGRDDDARQRTLYLQVAMSAGLPIKEINHLVDRGDLRRSGTAACVESG